jgi:hypothetical protein
MLVRFTKKADGQHRLTIVRDDGSVSQSQVIPGLGPNAIPHDLLHALVEKTLGFSRGVYGMVNIGVDMAGLLSPARKRLNKSEPELMYSEIITNLLQAETAYEGVGETLFEAELRRRCADAGFAGPKITDDDLRRAAATPGRLPSEVAGARRGGDPRGRPADTLKRRSVGGTGVSTILGLAALTLARARRAGQALGRARRARAPMTLACKDRGARNHTMASPEPKPRHASHQEPDSRNLGK